MPASAGEEHVSGPAWRGECLDSVLLVQPFESVPQPDASSEHDRHHHDVQVVDKAGRQECVDGGGSSAKADVKPCRCLPCEIENLGRAAADEVKGCAAHDERLALPMRQHEAGSAKYRLVAPPARPVVLRPRPG